MTKLRLWSVKAIKGNETIMSLRTTHKAVFLVVEQTSSGREFQMEGPATKNTLSPNPRLYETSNPTLVLILGMRYRLRHLVILYAEI